MDKVKAQANSLAQQANAGMAKLDNLPVQRKSDALLRSLGVAVLAERTGRGDAGTGAEIDRLVTEIGQHEAQHGIDIVQQTAQAAAQAQARGQMGQMGSGSYIASSPTAMDPNVSGAVPGAGAGYGAPAEPGFGGQTGPGGFPGEFPAGPQFPDAGQPQQPAPTFFPPASGPSGFPDAGPGGFPGADQPQAPSFPQAGGPAGFPQSVEVTPFPSADPQAGFPSTSPGEPEPDL